MEHPEKAYYSFNMVILITKWVHSDTFLQIKTIKGYEKISLFASHDTGTDVNISLRPAHNYFRLQLS